MKTIIFLILILFCFNCFAQNFELNSNLTDLVQKGLYEEVNDTVFLNQCQILLDQKKLSDFDLEYLGDSVIALNKKNNHFAKSYQNFHCYSTDFKNTQECRMKAVFTHNSITEPATLPSISLAKNPHDTSNGSKLKNIFIYTGLFIAGGFLINFFSKNELIVEYNF